MLNFKMTPHPVLTRFGAMLHPGTVKCAINNIFEYFWNCWYPGIFRHNSRVYWVLLWWIWISAQAPENGLSTPWIHRPNLPCVNKPGRGWGGVFLPHTLGLLIWTNHGVNASAFEYHCWPCPVDQLVASCSAITRRDTKPQTGFDELCKM